MGSLVTEVLAVFVLSCGQTDRHGWMLYSHNSHWQTPEKAKSYQCAHSSPWTEECRMLIFLAQNGNASIQHICFITLRSSTQQSTHHLAHCSCSLEILLEILRVKRAHILATNTRSINTHLFHRDTRFHHSYGYYYCQWWRRLVNAYDVKAGMVCLQC